MKKHKQAAFSLVFGIDPTETTSATSGALQKIGEYPDRALTDILFLTTNVLLASVLENQIIETNCSK